MKSIYDEHLNDNEMLLPHVFMGDLTRFVIAEAENPLARVPVGTLLAHLEGGIRNGSDEVKELIIVSFVENLIGETTTLKVLKPAMGPSLKREVERICG